MGAIFAPGLLAQKNTKFVKVRELPIKGRVLVSKGDEVTAETEVLRAELPGNLNILRVAERMGIEPEEVLVALKNKGFDIGSQINEGDILCENAGLFGLFRSQFKSSCAGIIEFISKSNGHIGIREPAIPLSINSYISGRVSSVVPDKSVTIESQGARVQGIFGVGGERVGKLEILKIDNNKILTMSDLPVDIKGKILVGGMSPSQEFLKALADLGAVGLITGSIDDTALKGYLGFDLGVAITGDEDLPMTVIITEGFGSLPLSHRVLATLKDFDGYECSINGATQVRAGAIRPEILIPHRGSIQKGDDSQGVGLSPGLRIRLIRVPFFGQFATVVELPNEPVTIETGAKTRVLKARLEDGTIAIVPRANVEIVS
jgi:hypothetical protein